jgi:hypothetical protein
MWRLVHSRKFHPGTKIRRRHKAVKSSCPVPTDHLSVHSYRQDLRRDRLNWIKVLSGLNGNEPSTRIDRIIEPDSAESVV